MCFVKSANAVAISAGIDDHTFSDRVCDASIEKRLLCDMRFCIAVYLDRTDLGATNTARIWSKWIASPNSAPVFTTDRVGTEAIAEGGSGK
jgi:hypothetical protein